MWFLRDKTNRRKSHKRPKLETLYNLHRREFMASVSNLPKTNIPDPFQSLAFYSVGSTIPPKKDRQPVLETTAQEDYGLEISSPEQRNLAYTQTLQDMREPSIQNLSRGEQRICSVLEDSGVGYRPQEVDPLEVLGMHITDNP